MTGELVLLTGGTGFLGSAVLVDLLKSGYRVRAAVRSQAKMDKIWAAPSISALDPHKTKLTAIIVPDLTAEGAYDEAVQGVDFIIHTAAPIPSTEDGSQLSKDQLEEVFVKTIVNGDLGLLQSALENGDRVKRIVMTSSTTAIAPPEVYLAETKERDVLRGPESRVAILPPPYTSELQAYCAAKAAALSASEAFIIDKALSFDLISIMPSLIFGKDELATSTKDLRTLSTKLLINGLLTGNQGEAAVNNVALCSDVARAHVRSLDSDIEGNQSFLITCAAIWEDTIPIAQKYFPGAFKSGLFKEGSPQSTIHLKWDASKTRNVLGIDIAIYEKMVEEVVGQYLDLRQKEGN